MTFNPTSETARQEVLEYAKTQMTSDDARKFLAEQGFFTGNLWRIEDVTSSYECSDKDAYKVLEMALTNDFVMSSIWEAIHIAAEQLNLEPK